MGKSFIHRSVFPLIIAISVFVAFSPALNNQFINWDDNTHIVENPKIQKLNFKVLKDIFTRDFDRIVPLTIISFSIEKTFFGLNPFIVHLDNVLLHMGVCLLVYYLFLRFGLSCESAFILTLIFGLHPTKVESVAWATERKDVLYAFFYILALHCHLSFIRQKEKRFYVLAILAGFLSMLSKPAALTLPIILLLLDFREKRKFRESWMEKIPYLVFIVPYALTAMSVYSVYSKENFFSGMLVWLWSLSFYLMKFLWPVILLPIYVIAKPISILNLAYFSSIVLLGICIFLVWNFRRNKDVVTAAGLFFIPIFFVLHNNENLNINTVADRYLYLPSLGLCWLFVILFSFLIDRWKSIILKVSLYLILFFIFLSLGIKTFVQSCIWHDNISLWSHQLRYVPHESAYQNRGGAYYFNKQYSLAIDDYDKGLALNPKFVKLYINRGLVFMAESKLSEAMMSFNKALSLEKNNILALNNRGVIFIKEKHFDAALEDFDHILRIDSKNSEAFCNRGVLFMELNDFEKALENLNLSIRLNSNYAEAFYNRGGVYYRQRKWDLAFKDFNRAVEIKPTYIKAVYYRGILNYHQNDIAGAVSDFNEVLRLDPYFVDAYVTRGALWVRQNKDDLALKDFNKALEIDPDNRQANNEVKKLLTRR